MRCRCGRPIQVSDRRPIRSAVQGPVAAFQFAPANDSSPTRVWSRGGGGSAAQANTGSSLGNSGNQATTDGEAMQTS